MSVEKEKEMKPSLARVLSRLAKARSSRVVLILLALVVAMSSQEPAVAGWCVTC